MPTSFTVKNIPDQLYARLKESAAANRRSVNSETIVRLELALAPGRVSPDERLERARALRAGLPAEAFDAADMDALKRQGRP